MDQKEGLASQLISAASLVSGRPGEWIGYAGGSGGAFSAGLEC
jgi:hypothetical protein